MISSIHIEGYRGFQDFRMEGLGRVNLLVGPNNGGKTSVLEAVYLLAAQGHPKMLWDLLSMRDEGKVRDSFDVRHLFFGHEISEGIVVSLGSEEQTVVLSVAASSLRMERFPKQPVVLQLEPSGSLSSETIAPFAGLLSKPPRNIQFLPADSLKSEDLVELWNKVVLTPDEDLVLESLRLLDPEIERIAAHVPVGDRGGFIVKRRGDASPVPVGSFGDGIWRALCLLIALTQCRGGTLLVDEVDNGLHRTVLDPLWSLIFKTAKELDVQVFATTHSFDCVQSLAAICPEENDQAPQSEQVTLHRIERQRAKSIAYNQPKIRIVAEQGVEVR